MWYLPSVVFTMQYLWYLSFSICDICYAHSMCDICHAVFVIFDMKYMWYLLAVFVTFSMQYLLYLQCSICDICLQCLWYLPCSICYIFHPVFTTFAMQYLRHFPFSFMAFTMRYFTRCYWLPCNRSFQDQTGIREDRFRQGLRKRPGCAVWSGQIISQVSIRLILMDLLIHLFINRFID